MILSLEFMGHVPVLGSSRFYAEDGWAITPVIGGVRLTRGEQMHSVYGVPFVTTEGVTEEEREEHERLRQRIMQEARRQGVDSGVATVDDDVRGLWADQLPPANEVAVTDEVTVEKITSKKGKKK